MKSLRNSPVEVGEALSSVLRNATKDVVLVAPFMKAGALLRLLENVKKEVKLDCFTRWRPEEVASGVSDLEVADIIEAQPKGKLFLIPNLHAKLYCGDDRAVATSANLTGTALGWRKPSNLELSVLVPRDTPAIACFEDEIRAVSVLATPEIRALVENAATLFPAHRQPGAWEAWSQDQELSRGSASPLQWMPVTLIPSKLFSLYEGRDHHVSRNAANDAYRDLEMLRVPPGLDHSAFREVVRALVVQHPVLGGMREAARTAALSNINAEGFLSLADSRGFSGKEEMFRVAAQWLAWWFSDELELQQEGETTTLRPLYRPSG